jgi:FtsZ-interacting cell division protein ZipA
LKPSSHRRHSLISFNLFVLQWAWRREKERGKGMGKHGKKKHKESNHRASRRLHQDDDDYSALPSSSFDLPPPSQEDDEEEQKEREEYDDEEKQGMEADSPSKFHLYQLSVQVASIYVLHF